MLGLQQWTVVWNLHNPTVFPIPEEYSHTHLLLSSDNSNNSCLMELRDSPDRNHRGWFAAQILPAGTLMLIAKPTAMVMDWEGEEESGPYSHLMIEQLEHHALFSKVTVEEIAKRLPLII
jgi:hypothetical protein